MPVEFRIDTIRGIVLTQGRGRISYAEVQQHLNALRSHPDFRPELSEFADLAEITGADVTYDSLKNLLTGIAKDPFHGSARRALYAPRDVIYGLCRMYEMLLPGEHENFRVFREKREACAWVKLEPNDVE